MPKAYNEDFEKARVNDLNTLLKLFGHHDHAAFKLPIPAYRNHWRIFPFHVNDHRGANYHRFETYEELRMYVHRTMIPSAQKFPGGLRPHVVCPECEDCGWTTNCYQGDYPPRFTRCDTCGNPNDLNCP